MQKEFYNIMREWKSEAGVDTPVSVSAYPGSTEILKIITTDPNAMIGYKGELVDKYLEKLKTEFPDIKRIGFILSDVVII